MLRELRTYYRPQTLDEALALLDQRMLKIVPLAGGTELLGRHDTTIEAVVDLQDLQLDRVHAQAGGLRLGAMLRLQQLIDDSALQDFADGLLARAAQLAAPYTERVSSTLGGTVAGAPGWHDLLPALLVTDAQVELRARTRESVVPLADVLTERARHLTAGTLITALIIPAQATQARFAYERVARTPRDRALVSVAVRVAPTDAEGENHVRVAVGGAAAHALRVPAVESLLHAAPFEVDAAARALSTALTPPSDHLASGEYRAAMLPVLLRRALAATAR